VIRIPVAYPDPGDLFDVQRFVRCVDEKELSRRKLPVKLAITPHDGGAVGTSFDDGETIRDESSGLAVRLERLDDEPLVRVRRANVSPLHVMDATSRRGGGQLFVPEKIRFLDGLRFTLDEIEKIRCGPEPFAAKQQVAKSIMNTSLVSASSRQDAQYPQRFRIAALDQLKAQQDALLAPPNLDRPSVAHLKKVDAAHRRAGRPWCVLSPAPAD